MSSSNTGKILKGLKCKLTSSFLHNVLWRGPHCIIRHQWWWTWCVSWSISVGLYSWGSWFCFCSVCCIARTRSQYFFYLNLLLKISDAALLERWKKCAGWVFCLYLLTPLSLWGWYSWSISPGTWQPVLPWALALKVLIEPQSSCFGNIIF